ncbi:hypothetical protein ACQ4PT_048312 [Festuca glaucescens]
MPGAGRCLASQRRQLASNLVDGSFSNLALLPSGRPGEGFSPFPSSEYVGTPPKAAQNRAALPANLANAGLSPVPSSNRVFGTLLKPAQNVSSNMRVLKIKGCFLPGLTAGVSMVTTYGAHTLVLQSKLNFCTSAGDPVVTTTGDESDNDGVVSFITQQGNVDALCQRVAVEVQEMKTKVLGFQARYNKLIRPGLSSRCLIVPGTMSDDSSTVFLHRQTFKIAKQNPGYLSSFDIMSYEGSREKDDDWGRFLKHLVDRKIYVIEDWYATFSSIQILMYDHGLKQPDDGTTDPFFKGECDASFDSSTGTASLSYIIWKDGKIIFSEVFANVKCSSAVEGEIYAACALLHKAEELKISKLLVCSDSMTVVKILNGEQKIAMGHLQRDFFLMLRAMRSRFKWLVVNWKPRELMVFVDELANFAKLSGSYPGYSKYSAQKWSDHLRGRPIFRIERTDSTPDKFANVTLNESYATMVGSSIYYVEVPDDLKFDCLVGLSQRLQPSEMSVFLANYNGKSESFKQQFKAGYREISEYNSGSYSMFTNMFVSTLQTRSLVVSLDYTVPKGVYFNKDAFHVVFVTPSERENMTENIPELTALGYVYFNGVRLPLTHDGGKNKDGKKDGGKKNGGKKKKKN